MTTETVPMDDAALFQAATADEPALTETTVEQPVETVTEQPRDESGRFAPKSQETTPETPARVEPEKEPGIPSWRLKEESDARRDAVQKLEEFQRREWQRDQEMRQLQQQLQQFQAPKVDPVDPYADLPGAIKQTISPFETQFSSLASELRFNASETRAIVIHGQKAVDEMKAAISKAQQSGNPELQMLSQQMDSSRDPVGVAMKWFQNHRLVETTGGDIEAYKQKLLEDPEFLGKAVEAARAKAGQPGQKTLSTIQLPPSLNKVAASMTNESVDNDMSDGAMWRHATAR